MGLPITKKKIDPITGLPIPDPAAMVATGTTSALPDPATTVATGMTGDSSLTPKSALPDTGGTEAATDVATGTPLPDTMPKVTPATTPVVAESETPIPWDYNLPIDPVTHQPRPEDIKRRESDLVRQFDYGPNPSGRMGEYSVDTPWGPVKVQGRQLYWAVRVDQSYTGGQAEWQDPIVLRNPPDYLSPEMKAQWERYNKDLEDAVNRLTNNGAEPVGGGTYDPRTHTFNPYQREQTKSGAYRDEINRLQAMVKFTEARQNMMMGTTQPPGMNTEITTSGITTGAGTPISESDRYKEMEELKNNAGSSTAGQMAVTNAMAGYQSTLAGTDTGGGWQPPELTAAEREASGGGSTATGGGGAQRQAAGGGTGGGSSDTTAQIATGTQAAAAGGSQAQMQRNARLGQLGKDLQEAISKGDMRAVGKINEEMVALIRQTTTTGTQNQQATDGGGWQPLALTAAEREASGGGSTATGGGGAQRQAASGDGGGLPVADGGGTGTTGGGGDLAQNSDFNELLNKLKQGVGVTPNDVPTGLTQELLDSIMKQSPELTPEQRAVIERQADEAMAKALSALSARGLGASSDAAGAIVQGEFQKQSMIAAEQARIRSENTRNALAAAGLSIENLKNAQGYSIQQRLATLQETLGIADIVQKQQDAAARANEFAKTFGLDQSKFGEVVRQYNLSFGLDTAKFEEIKKQFADQFGLDTAKFNEAAKQFQQEFGLDTAKFAEAKKEFEAEYNLKVDDQSFMHALQTGQLNLEAVKVDNASRIAEIQTANDFIARSNDTDLQAKLGFSKLELQAMIAGKEIDLAIVTQGIERWSRQMGFDIDMTKLDLELQALKSANKADYLDIITKFVTTGIKYYLATQTGVPAPV